MSEFYMILTNTGFAKMTNAQITSSKVNLTHIAVGDGNGAHYAPQQTATALKKEVWRGPVSSVAPDATNPNWLNIEGLIPATAGGFTIREVGIYDVDGDLIAIGKVPETYKPVLAEGSTKDLYLKVILEVANARSVNMIVDTNVIVASRKYVADKIDPLTQQLEQITKFPEDFGCIGDGVADDTIPLQTAFDFIVQNNAKLRLTGHYKVNPKLMADGSKVCLMLYQDNQDNITHGFEDSSEIEFAQSARIFTDSTEECTLVRQKASNTRWYNFDLRGVKDKTVLIEFARKNRLDNTEKDFIVYNALSTGRFYNSKCAIQVEGQGFYNSFTDIWFLNNRRCIWLKESEYQITSGDRNSNVNRNNFTNLTMAVGNNEGIRIDYGDTNKFTNISFEGLTDWCIYLNDIGTTIPNRYYTEGNVFINVTMEACPKQIYDNALATQYLYVNYQLDKCNFLQEPKTLINSMNAAYAPTKLHSLVVTTEEKMNLPKTWSSHITSVGGLFAKDFSDYESENTVTNGTHNFLQEQCTNISDLVFNGSTSLPYYKAIGKILHYLCRFKCKVINTTQNIIIPLPRAPRGNYYGFNNVTSTTKQVIMEDNTTGKIYTCYATIGSAGITIKPPVQYSVSNGALVETKAFPSNTLAFCIEMDYLI